MKAYLINLARSKERLAAADAQLRAAGVAYERVEAVDGRALSRRERRRLCSAVRFWAIQGMWPRREEIGCALSHQAVYRRMLEAGEPLAAVFEDDVEVLDAAWLREALARIEASDKPSEPTVWRLERRPSEPVAAERGFYPLGGATALAGAYVVNAAGARLILRLNRTPIVAVADAWARWARQGLRVWSVRPEPCRQCGAPSTITPIRVRPRRAGWGWYRAVWGVKARLRAWGLLAFDRAMTGLTGR